MSFLKKIGKAVGKVALKGVFPAATLTKALTKAAAPLVSKLMSSLGKDIKSVVDTLTPLLQNFTKDLQTNFNSKFDTLQNNVSGLQSLVDTRLNGGQISGSATPVGGGNPLEDKLLGVANNLDAQMRSLTDQLNNPNLTEGQMLKLSTQLQRVTRMFELVSQMLKQMHDVQTGFIRSIAR